MSKLSPLWEGRGPSFEQNWIPFTQGYLCQVWLKMTQCFWRNQFSLGKMYYLKKNLFTNIVLSSQCIVINMYVKLYVCSYKPEILNYSVMEITYTQMRSFRNYLDKLKMRLEKNHNIYLLHFPNVWNAARWLKSSHFWNHVDLKWKYLK